MRRGVVGDATGGEIRGGGLGAVAGLVPSLRDLPQHGADYEPVKRQDDRQIGSAEQVMRAHQRGRGDALAMAASRDVHRDAKIQMMIVKACASRSGDWLTIGNIPMVSEALASLDVDVFRPKGVTR